MRATSKDGRLGPFENKATNPSFERAASGTTILRRNLTPGPTPGGPGWFAGYGTGGSGTFTIRSSDGPTPALSTYYRTTWSTVSTGITRGVIQGNTVSTGAVVTPGRSYTISAWGRTSRLDMALSIRLRWKTSAGGTISDITSSPLSNHNGQWHRLSASGVAVATAAYIEVGIVLPTTGDVNIGDWVDGTGILVEQSPSLAPYFDGSTTDASGFAYSWEGTTGASTSVAKASSVEVRRNMVLNPNFESTTSNWTQYGGASMARSSSIQHLGTYSLQITNTNASASQGDVRIYENLSNLGSFVAGATYTFSAYVYMPTALTGPDNTSGSRQRRIVYWYSTDGGTYNPSFGPQISNTAGVWQRVSHTFTLPSNATGLSLGIGCAGSSTDSNFVVYIDSVLLEKSPVLGTYFDGSQTPDGDLMPSWTGTVNGSASILSGALANTITSNSASFISWGWSSRGSTSLRIISKVSTTDSFASIGGDINAMRLGMQPGRTYTALARIRLLAPQTSPSGTSSRLIRIYYYSNGSYKNIDSIQATNSAGETALRVTATLPPDTTQAFIRLYNGTSTDNGDVYWDEFMLVEGVYKGNYLDGDSAKSNWLGTAHASTSAGYQ